MTLIGWLILLCGLLGIVAALDARRRACRAKVFANLARAGRMNYSAVDRFDLARRLQRSSQWTAGIQVRDVLYGSHGERRFFIATVERRASADDRPQPYIITCSEPMDHTTLTMIRAEPAATSWRGTKSAYELALASLAA